MFSGNSLRSKTIVGLTAAVGLSLLGLVPAFAAETKYWASIENWNATAKTGTITITGAKGFPAATIESNSKGTTGPASAAWLDTWTPPGAIYGSSKTKQYLNLGPISSTQPSTTTYTFQTPTPASGWMFALGDVDAETLEISAKDSLGNPVSMTDLGHKSNFNYCNYSSGLPTSCGGAQATVTPNWDNSTGRLEAPSSVDTNGASAWFEPTVSLSSLTVKSISRSGFPVYQTWFAALSRDITGTITGAAGCSNVDLEVVLRDSNNEIIATTTSDANGSWAFSSIATYEDWKVSVNAPEGCRVDDGSDNIADLSSADAVINVTLEAVQGSVSGSVTDQNGDGVEDVTLEIDTSDGDITLSTDSDGEFGPEGLPAGATSITVIPPEGYFVDGDDIVNFDITNAGEDLEVNFTLINESDSNNGSEDSLPETGGPSSWPIALALLLTILGSARLIQLRFSSE